MPKPAGAGGTVVPAGGWVGDGAGSAVGEADGRVGVAVGTTVLSVTVGTGVAVDAGTVGPAVAAGADADGAGADGSDDRAGADGMVPLFVGALTGADDGPEYTGAVVTWRAGTRAGPGTGPAVPAADT